MGSIFKTTILLSLLTAILLFAGFIFAGTGGIILALGFALFMNFIMYWYSDKIILGMYKAKPSDNKTLNSIVGKLAKEAKIPKPKVYIVPTAVPNAFATGRNPKHAAVAATQGLLDNLNTDEMEGVLAHELAHIKNRDTLIATLAATIGGAISFLAHMAWWSLFMGDRRNQGTMMFLPLLILAPLAAVLVQMAISRGREFQADYLGAMTSKKPGALASALMKISNTSKNHPIKGNAATAHMFIINPFKADGFSRLFSTHPSTELRIKRLKEMKV